MFLEEAAIVCEQLGGPEVMQYQDVPRLAICPLPSASVDRTSIGRTITHLVVVRWNLPTTKKR